LLDNLVLSSTALDRIEQTYGLSDTERSFLTQLAAHRQAELRRMADALAEEAKKNATGAAAKPAKPAPENPDASRKDTVPPPPKEPAPSAAGTPAK
jgi:hypothetical protein